MFLNVNILAKQVMDFAAAVGPVALKMLAAVAKDVLIVRTCAVMDTFVRQVLGAVAHRATANRLAGVVVAIKVKSILSTDPNVAQMATTALLEAAASDARTTEYTEYSYSYSYYYSVYVWWYLSYYPSYTPTASTTVTTTTTISAYVTNSADAESSFAEITSSIASDASWSASFNSDLATILASASNALESVNSALGTTGTTGLSGGSSSGGGTSTASSWKANVLGALFGIVAIVVGMLAIAL
ncbi:hypothetical protein HII31_10216 [Pseudocercospora fuligena]|uniref:Uncharacterized protein n=1 Tax=Pseudocercospora fuligena TaxID=685502 RepID=A0A8H6RCR0_9PEZI|nr:hypothetical protein HII31_10216 [Pseudocercospora fuligena]